MRTTVLLALVAALGTARANAADPNSIHRIGVLMDPIPSQEEGLRQGLLEFGYIEGENLLIEWRRSSARNEELESLATDLARSNVELIVASGTPAARAGSHATTLPVVFLAIDPVGSGLVVSLSKPGGRNTGMSAVGAELTAKRLELLRMFSPRARRIVYLTNSTNPAAARLLESAQDAARALSLQLIPLDARNSAEIDVAFRASLKTNADGFLLAPDFLFLANKRKIASGARSLRLPTMSPTREIELLMSYGPDLREAMRRTASYVDKILRGGKPSDLPVEQVSKYEFVINLRVARAMGLEVPQTLLLRADEIVQ